MRHTLRAASPTFHQASRLETSRLSGKHSRLWSRSQVALFFLDDRGQERKGETVPLLGN